MKTLLAVKGWKLKAIERSRDNPGMIQLIFLSTGTSAPRILSIADDEFFDEAGTRISTSDI